ncbi:MAG: hypothetical protein R3243_07465 [Arenibacter latericius]|nr:hypothetical protein [Arenibacter latericius]
MKYAIMIGSNMFIGTSGVLSVDCDGTSKEFFRVREINRARSEGTYLAVDCDIKDVDNIREIKLFKNNPVAADENVTVSQDKKRMTAKRADGTLIIGVEQLKVTDQSLPQNGPIKELLDKNPVDAILRITGNFHAGGHKLVADNEKLRVDTNTLAGNLSVGTGGLKLTADGFAM